MKHLLISICIIQSSLLLSHPPSTEIINRTSHFMLHNNGMVQIDTVLMQINDRSADTEILIPYSKGDRVNVEKVWMEDLQGNIIRNLKKNEIKDRSYISSISLYEDVFVKYFDLKHDKYPYRIHYISRITYAKSLNSIEVDYTRASTPIRSGTLIVEVPLDDSIRYKYKNMESPIITIKDQYRKMIWKYDYMPPTSIEAYSLDKDSKAPSIHVVPLNFKYGESGSFESWQTFGNWISRLNNNKDKLTPEESKIVESMTLHGNSKKQKVETLYRYLQDHTRYINVSIKLGGLQTYPASYVCKNKYGDCKALSNYLQSLLKHIGIESYYTLVDAGSKVPELDIDFPSQAFNHVILTVPLDNDTVFLECTDKNIPFGYMGTFTQSRKALLVSDNNSHLIDIPALQPEEVLCSRTIRVKPEAGEIYLQEVQRGSKYEFFNYVSNELGKDRMDEIIRSSLLPGKAELTGYQLRANNRQFPEIGVEARFNIENPYAEYGKNIILPPFPSGIKNFENLSERKTGVQIDYPEFYKDTVYYEIPGRQLASLPGKISIDNDFGRYEISFDHTDDTLVCYKSFLLYAGKYPFERYEAFFHFIQVVKNNETKNIHIETL